MLLIAVVCSGALGDGDRVLPKDMQGLPVFDMKILVMPIFFLSGAMFPLPPLPAENEFTHKNGPARLRFIDGIRGT